MEKILEPKPDDDEEVVNYSYEARDLAEKWRNFCKTINTKYPKYQEKIK